MKDINEIADQQPVRLLNSRTVRERLDISKVTLQRWTKNPDLGFPSPIVIGGRHYWREADLVAFIQQQENAA